MYLVCGAILTFILRSLASCKK